MEFENKMCDPQINEFFMDFINIESTTGFSLANVLIEQLQHYVLIYKIVEDKLTTMVEI